MSNYSLIDEPKPKAYEHLIVDPLVIFFAAILVPLFWNPPMLGRIWMPLLWLCVNSFLLGSPTLLKEIIIAIGGFALWYVFMYLCIYPMIFLNLNAYVDSAIPYFRILNQGVFYLSLYLLVFIQRTPYSIFQYIKELGARR